MNKTDRVQLSEIASLITKGTTPTTIGYDFQDSGINFLKIECFDEYGNYVESKVAHISDECNEKQKRSQLKSGDILFSIAGAIGRVAIVTDEMLPANTNQALAIIRIVREDVYLPFIKLILLSPLVKEQFEKKKQGVAQLNISLKDISELTIPLPEINEQIALAALFEKVEGIINKRQQQISALDNLIKARFVEMFGDTERYPQESLDSNVHEMFIGPFGSALKNDNFVDPEDGFCIVYEQKHAIKKTMDVPTRYVDEKKYRELRRFSVYPGDIIVSCRGTIGEIFIVPEGAPLGIMHPSIMKIRLNTEKYNQKFFVLALENYMEEHNNEAKGSGVKMAVTATTLGREAFPVPPMEVQKQFAAFVDQIDKSKSVIQKSLDETRVLFDSLMQDYFG